MRWLSLALLAAAAAAAVPGPHAAAQEKIIVGWIDNFDKLEGWTMNNPKTPPEFSVKNGILTLTDPPGGQVTWGTSIYRNIGEIDLSQTPWLVAKTVAQTGRFNITLINRKTREKRGGLAPLSEPGIVVVNVPERTGWRGVVDLSIGLYVQGTEKSVSVDWVKFVSALTEEEKRALRFVPKARQPLPAHGLRMLVQKRCWWRPELRRRGEAYLSERLVYRDSATGNIVWKMTAYPGVDKVIYYDIPEWNADGSLLLFLTRRGEAPVWIMNSEGTSLRPLLAEGKPIKQGYWSGIYPDIFYASESDSQGTRVLAVNVRTGKKEVVAQSKIAGLSLFPPHPREEHFLLAANATAQRECVVVIAGRDGSERAVPVGGRFHRLRFTKRDDLSIFFNRDDPRTQWVIGADGTGLHQLPDAGGHPDWTPDGAELTYYFAGAIWAVRWDGSGKRRIADLNSGGHGSTTLDGKYFVSDTPRGGYFPQSILYLPLDGRGICQRVAFHGSSYLAHTEATYSHPDHHSTHPHPSASPDGTKTVFASDYLGAFTDIYVAINRYPDPPRNLRAAREGRAVVLSWQPPERRRELAGYAVYRTTESGRNFARINRKLAGETTFRDENAPIGTLYYLVTAVEHSGLEGLPSNEACASASGAWEGPVRHFVEAEAGEFAMPTREFICQEDCSGGYYVGLHGATRGELWVTYNAPRAGRYLVWVRARGGGEVKLENGPAAQATRGWGWVKLPGAIALKKGANRVKLSFSGADGGVDKLCFTDDAQFIPQGFARILKLPPPPPQKPKATALDPFHVKLTWPPASDPSVAYYNIYVLPEAEAYPSQLSRVGSPAEPEFVDCGLLPGSTVYYRVTAVDGLGQESEASPPAKVTMPQLQLVRLAVEAEQGEPGPGFRIAEDAQASGGKLLAPDEKASARERTLKLTFTIPRAGEYAIWARLRYPGPARRTVAVSLDDGRSWRWPLFGWYNKFIWAPVSPDRCMQPKPLSLSAGKHALQLRAPVSGLELDKFVITNDATAMPDSYSAEPLSAEQRAAEGGRPIIPTGPVLFEDDFRRGLGNWYHEGAGRMVIERPGIMRIEIIGSRQGGAGCQAFCRKDFPDHIAIEYDLKVLTKNGLIITFFAMQGLHSEDMIAGGLPPRQGVFKDYTGPDAALKSYHVSISRYGDTGEHTGVSNWRRNPGLHLMGSGPDLCREIGQWYRIRIVKDGLHCQLQVNGVLAHEFTDPNELDLPLPTEGKVGFRAIGSDVRALIRNFRVRALR